MNISETIKIVAVTDLGNFLGKINMIPLLYIMKRTFNGCCYSVSYTMGKVRTCKIADSGG